MEQHIKILSVLFIVFGILGLAAAVTFFAIGWGASALILASDASHQGRVGAAWTGGCLTAIAALLGLLSIPNVIAGWGLSKRKAWARILTIILAVLNLPHVPVGTALGFYALVIMFNDESKLLLNQ